MEQKSVKMRTCPCGCSIFETIRTYQYEDSDFYIDSRSKDIKVAVNGIPVAKCIECGKINVPSTSMAGISVMDPRVIAYRELLRAVKVRNTKIDELGILPVSVVGMECALMSMIDKHVCGCNTKIVEAAIFDIDRLDEPIVKVEVPIVETATRGRKKSTATVPES